MTQTIIRIGNSAGVILPLDIREENDIHIGDKITFGNSKGNILLKKVKVQKKVTPKITAKFAQMVDSFMTEHKDVLEELAKK